MSLSVKIKPVKGTVSIYKGRSCVVVQCYTELKEFLPVLRVVDLEPNPRHPSRSPLVLDIINSLETSPYLYPALTRGLIISCSTHTYDEGSLEIAINKSEYFAQGILDGAHNALALISFALNKKPRDWEEAHRLLNESSKELPHEIQRVLVPVCFIHPYDKSSMSAEEIKKDLDKIKETRNSSVSVPKSALAHNRGSLDSLKRALSHELNGRIAWIPDRSKTGLLKVQSVANLLIHTFYALGETHPVASLLCPPSMVIDKPATAFSCVEKVLKELGDDPQIIDCFKYIDEIARVFDRVQSTFIEAYNDLGKAWKYAPKPSPKSFFFNKPMDCYVELSIIHPIVHALVLSNLYINDGELKAKMSFEKIYAATFMVMMESVVEFLEDASDPKRFGANRLVYASLTRVTRKCLS